jgi:hypothetical protein
LPPMFHPCLAPEKPAERPQNAAYRKAHGASIFLSRPWQKIKSTAGPRHFAFPRIIRRRRLPRQKAEHRRPEELTNEELMAIAAGGLATAPSDSEDVH